MDKRPNILEQAFDYLSSIPHLKRFCQRMWVISTILCGFSILVEGIAIFTGKAEYRLEWIKNLILWVGVNPIFAYVLYLWNKRELSNQTASRKN